MTSDTQGIPNGDDMIIHSIRTEIFETLSDDMLPEDDGLQKMMKNRLANLAAVSEVSPQCKTR